MRSINVIGCYIVAIFSPSALAFYMHSSTEEGFFAQAGMFMGMTGIMILFFQFIISARIKWLDRLFAYNNLIDFHRRMGELAFTLIVIHFLLLAVSEKSWGLLTEVDNDWEVNLGKVAFLVLAVQVLSSIGHRFIGLKFEKWRSLHDLLAICLLVLVFIHSFYAGEDLESFPLQVVWLTLPPVALMFFTWQRFFRFTFAPTYKVLDVVEETRDTYSVHLVPEDGSSVKPYNPGQFHFIKFTNCTHLINEEHPFTISSSPTRLEYLTSTIKSVGDFTSQVHLLQKDDTVKIAGPFGKMSVVDKHFSGAIVFIAGGIGITPFQSMLQYMYDKDLGMNVVLLYFNRTEADIAFRKELENLVSLEEKFKVVHIISQQDDWEGERGRFSKDILLRHCPTPIMSNSYYVCGPPPMSKSVIEELKNLQVPLSNIHSEIFGLAESASPTTYHRQKISTVVRLIVLLLLVFSIIFSGLRSSWQLFGDLANL